MDATVRSSGMRGMVTPRRDSLHGSHSRLGNGIYRGFRRQTADFWEVAGEHNYKR